MVKLDDPKKFLVLPFYFPDEIGVYELTVGLDTYPVDDISNWKPETSIDLSQGDTLEIRGQRLSNQQVGELIKKLRKEHLIVNCDGACYVKNFEFENSVDIKQGAEPPSAYLRLADAFPWSDFGVTNFKFSGFSPPMYLTKGGTIDPTNLVPSPDKDALNKAQTTINGLTATINQLRDEVSKAQKALDEYKASILASFETAAAVNARPLAPSAFDVRYSTDSTIGGIGIAGNQYRFDFLDAGVSSTSIPQGSIVVYVEGEFDRSNWWISAIYNFVYERSITIAHYGGACGERLGRAVPWPSDTVARFADDSTYTYPTPNSRARIVLKIS